MLVEATHVRQIAGEPWRRWFFDEDIDLIVWTGRFRRIIGFQLCYDKQATERALTWRKGPGYTHQRVDVGKEKSGLKPTPILVDDGEFDNLKIAQLFRERSAKIDKRVAKFVYQRLLQYQHLAKT
jgi:hypothetical protein